MLSVFVGSSSVVRIANIWCRKFLEFQFLDDLPEELDSTEEGKQAQTPVDSMKNKARSHIAFLICAQMVCLVLASATFILLECFNDLL